VLISWPGGTKDLESLISWHENFSYRILKRLLAGGQQILKKEKRERGRGKKKRRRRHSQ